MATKLHGLINLSKIDKSLITTNQRGEKVLWVDMVPRRAGADQYGNTHTITIYNKEARQTIYLGDLRPQEFGSGAAAPAPAAPAAPAHKEPGDDNEDLPF